MDREHTSYEYWSNRLRTRVRPREIYWCKQIMACLLHYFITSLLQSDVRLILRCRSCRWLRVGCRRLSFFALRFRLPIVLVWPRTALRTRNERSNGSFHLDQWSAPYGIIEPEGGSFDPVIVDIFWYVRHPLRRLHWYVWLRRLLCSFTFKVCVHVSAHFHEAL